MIVSLTSAKTSDNHSIMESGEIYKILGATIRHRRRLLGHTQAVLASQLGLSRASLANIEGGRQRVLVHQLYKIAEALQMNSVQDLIPVSPGDRSPAKDSERLPISADNLRPDQIEQVKDLMR